MSNAATSDEPDEEDLVDPRHWPLLMALLAAAPAVMDAGDEDIDPLV